MHSCKVCVMAALARVTGALARVMSAHCSRLGNLHTLFLLTSCMHGVARMRDTHMHACMHDVVRHGCTCSRHLRPFGAKLGSTGNSRFAIFRSQPSLTSKLQKLRISTPLTQKRKGGRGVGGFWFQKLAFRIYETRVFFSVVF